jgi:hypothetical protein
VVSEQEIADYYQGHISEFEEVQLRRMLVPLNSVAVAGKQPAEKQMLEIATEFRDRAANGENLDQLQKEAYLAVGLTTLPPATEVGTRRRAGLTAAVGADVFALKAGEVSGIEKEAYSLVVYKVDAKWTLPEERVKEEISREIVKHKLEAALRSVTEGVHTDLNESYFGSAPER